MEIQGDPATIRNYINQYQGNSRFIRLITLAEKQPQFRAEALKLCFELVKQEKKLNYYYDIVKFLRRAYNEKPEECPFPDFGIDSSFERNVQQEYKNEVKKKEQEIQQLQKSLLRDSMRIAFNDLGKIHYQFGYVNEAIKSWVKSHDFSTQEEDLFNMAFQIAQAGFESLSSSYLMKYSGEADARDKQKNPVKTMQIKILDGLASLLSEQFSGAAHRLSQVSIVDDQAILQFLTPQDLAYYITITALQSLDRKELKNILGSSNFKNLMEIVPQTSDIIENFLNGRYMEFQQSLAAITHALQFDLFFGHRIHSLVGQIRKKALIQYVTPYKVIDMREIAKAFDLSIEQIESEIAELIVKKKIQAKIDSHSKVIPIRLTFVQLLYSKKDNETLNSYKEAVQLGRVFIQETESALLRVQALQKNKVLKQQHQIREGSARDVQ